MLVKKYSNRRLYDSDASRYITIGELTDRIQAGAEAVVLDAKTGEDITQATLTQVIMEGRGASHLLPASLLHQLIRLGDDALGEFFGRYVGFALEMYLQTRQTVQSLAPPNPFAAFNPLSPSAYFRPFLGGGQPQQLAPPPPPQAPSSDVETLKREMAELKKMLRKRKQ